MKIYIVKGHHGEYSDYSVRNVISFTDEQLALDFRTSIEVFQKKYHSYVNDIIAPFIIEEQNKLFASNNIPPKPDSLDNYKLYNDWWDRYHQSALKIDDVIEHINGEMKELYKTSLSFEECFVCNLLHPYEEETFSIEQLECL